MSNWFLSLIPTLSTTDNFWSKTQKSTSFEDMVSLRDGVHLEATVMLTFDHHPLQPPHYVALYYTVYVFCLLAQVCFNPNHDLFLKPYQFGA